jgi:hypothetical protein
MKLNKVILRILVGLLSLTQLSGCNFFSSVWSNVAEKGETAWNDIVTWSQSIWANTVDWSSSAWDSVSNWGKATWKNTVDWSTNTGEAVANWGSTVIDGTKAAYCTVGDYVVSVKDKAVAFGLKKGVKSLGLAQPTFTSEVPDKYVGDNEALVYSLISSQLSKAYEVFPARVVLPSSGDEVYGYGFTDTKTAFVYKKDTALEEKYFSTGFISLVDEFPISDADYQTGLEIYRTDDTDLTNYHYCYAFNCDAFTAQCIANNQYLKYGVNSAHQIFYEAAPYNSQYDASLSDLYSYDKAAYIHGDGSQGLIPEKGSTSEEDFDYEAWKEESDGEASSGFSITLSSLKDVVTEGIVTVRDVLSNIKEKTFLGYKLSDLQKEANNTTENDIATIDDDKVAMHAVSPNVPSDLVKWIIGISVASILMANIVVFAFFPSLKTVKGALTSAMIQAIVQLVINKGSVQDVNWAKVGVAALGGAICANSGFYTDIIVKSLVNTVFALVDDNTILDGSLTFLSSIILGLAIGSAFKSVSEKAGLKAAKLSPSMTSVIKSLVKNRQLISDGKLTDQIENAMIDATLYQSSKAGQNASDPSTDASNRDIAKACKSLPSDYNSAFYKVDAEGNPLSKAGLFKMGGNGYLALKDPENNSYRTYFHDKNGNSVDKLPIAKGLIQYDNLASAEIKLSTPLASSRQHNFSALDETLKSMLANQNSSISSSIYNYFTSQGKSTSSLTMSDLQQMRSVTGLALTWHESDDGYTGLLVPTPIHSVLSNMQGVAITKAKESCNVPVSYFLA